MPTSLQQILLFFANAKPQNPQPANENGVSGLSVGPGTQDPTYQDWLRANEQSLDTLTAEESAAISNGDQPAFIYMPAPGPGGSNYYSSSPVLKTDVPAYTWPVQGTPSLVTQQPLGTEANKYESLVEAGSRYDDAKGTVSADGVITPWAAPGSKFATDYKLAYDALPQNLKSTVNPMMARPVEGFNALWLANHLPNQPNLNYAGLTLTQWKANFGKPLGDMAGLSQRRSIPLAKPKAQPPGFLQSLLQGLMTITVGNSLLDSINLVANSLNTQTVRKDPLILNLGGTQSALTSYENGKQFDFNGDGFAVQTAWLQPGSDEAFLVYDPSDAAVTSGASLFGVDYQLPDGSLANSGYQALASLDTNGDGVIDANDPGFSNLRLLMPDGSLETLSAAGISSLNCSRFSNTSVTDANGNQQLDIGSFTFANGTTGFMGDYNLIEDPSETTALSTLPVSPAVAALPDIAGQGTVYSLQQAVMHDSTGTLQNLVEQFIASTDPTQQNALLEQIMTAWAGANPQQQDGANPEHIAVDSNLAGIVYSGVGPAQTGDGHGIALEAAYQLYKENAWAQLMSQSQLQPVFSQITAYYDDLGDTFYDLSAAINYLQQNLQNNYQQGVQDIANTYRALIDLGYDQTAGDFSDFYSAFSSDPTIKAAMDGAGKTAVASGTYFNTADPNMLMDLSGANGVNVYAGIGDTLLFDKGDGQIS